MPLKPDRIKIDPEVRRALQAISAHEIGVRILAVQIAKGWYIDPIGTPAVGNEWFKRWILYRCPYGCAGAVIHDVMAQSATGIGEASVRAG